MTRPRVTQYDAPVVVAEGYVMLGNMRIMRPKLRRAEDVAAEAKASAPTPAAAKVTETAVPDGPHDLIMDANS